MNCRLVIEHEMYMAKIKFARKFMQSYRITLLLLLMVLIVKRYLLCQFSSVSQILLQFSYLALLYAITVLHGVNDTATRLAPFGICILSYIATKQELFPEEMVDPSDPN